MKRRDLAVGIFWRMVGFCIFGGMALGGFYGAVLVLVVSVLPVQSRENLNESNQVLLGLPFFGGMFGAIYGVVMGAVLGLAHGVVLAALSLWFPRSLSRVISHSRAAGAVLATITTLFVAVGLPVALDHDHRLFYGFERGFALTSVFPALIAGVWCGWSASWVLNWARQEQLSSSTQAT